MTQFDWGTGGRRKAPIDVDKVSALGTTSSGIVGNKAVFFGIFMASDGTNDVTFAAYDGTSTAGTLLMPIVTLAGTNNAATIYSERPKGCTTGIYVDVTCSGTYSYKVYYDDNQ